MAEPEERDFAQTLRVVFDQILQFEKTECPFKRTFSVPLPEKPTLPVKKRPWTPVLKPSPLSGPVVPDTTSDSSSAVRQANSTPPKYKQAEEGLPAMEAQCQIPETHGRHVVEPEASTKEFRTQTHPSPEQMLNLTEERQPISSRGRISLGFDQSCPAHTLDLSDQTPHSPTRMHNLVNSDIGYPLENHRECPAEGSLDHVVVLRSSEQTVGHATLTPNATYKPPDGLSEIAHVGHDDNSRTAPCIQPALSPWLDSAVCFSPALELPGRKSSTVVIPERSIQDTDCIRPSTLFRQGDTPDYSKVDVYDIIRTYEKKSTAGIVTQPEVTPLVPLGMEAGQGPVTVDDIERDSATFLSGIDSSDVNETEDGVDGPATTEVHEGHGVVGARRNKLRGFRSGRSPVVPPKLTLVISPPSKSAVPRDLHPVSPVRGPEVLPEPVSPVGSLDSFHSVKSWHSASTPSPGLLALPEPTSSILPALPPDQSPKCETLMHNDTVSDMTMSPDTNSAWDMISNASSPSSQESAATAPDTPSDPGATAVEVNAAATIPEPPRRRFRHHVTASSISVGGRALSPLPPAANLFSPTSHERRTLVHDRIGLVRRLPMAIMAKTCEILLSPPSHLLTLMLRVAARITAGEWRGVVFGYSDGGETIPVHWDYSNDELDDWDDDDDCQLIDRPCEANANATAQARQALEVD